MVSLAFEVELDVSHEVATQQVEEALQDEGFGILTRIDLDAAFKEKIGLEFRQYTILGACNPTLAHRAVSSRAEIGLMLPCNITVEANGTARATVRISDPGVLMTVGGFDTDPVVAEVAEEARERLARVAAVLTAP
jgi:uncharacterized protein (DUF302 family)